MSQPDFSGAVAIHPGSVLGTEVLNQEMIGLGSDYEVPARKGLIVDFDISGIIAADCQGFIAKFPATDGQTVVTE